MTYARAAFLLPLIILLVGVVPHPAAAQSSGGANQTCKEWWAANKDKPQAMVTPPKCQENVSCNGSIGTVSGRCVQDKCKADTACGKPLEGKPDEDVQSGGAPQQGQQGSQSGTTDTKMDSLQRDLANTPLGQEFQNIFDQLEAPDTPTQLTAPGSQSALESLSRWQADALNAVSDITGATVNPINTVFGQMQQYLQNPLMSSPPQGWSFSPSPSGGPGSFTSNPAPSAGGGTFSNPWSSMAENLPGAQPTGSVIGEALVNAQEAAANAWRGVKEYSAAAWEKTMAALTPTDETLPGAGLPDSPNMTPEQELPGINVEQTPGGLPQNVAELAEQLDSPVVAEQVRNNYVDEILASKEEGWTPSQQQMEAARSIARENVQAARTALNDRNALEAWADRFITVSNEQRNLNNAIAQEQALAQLNRENFRSDAYLLQPNQPTPADQQPGIIGTQSTPNPQLARRLENIGSIADEAKAAERNYIEAMERAGLVQCKSPCSNMDPQYEAVPGLTDTERQRLAARVAPEREAFEKAMDKYTDYEKATEQAFLEERRAAGATDTFTAQTRAERAAQIALVGQREALTVDANDVFTSTAVTEFGSSLVKGDGISKFEITPAAEQRVLAKLYAASDRNALEYESCTSNCGQIAEAMRRTEGYIQQIERGEYTDTGLRSLLVKESNQSPGSFGQSFRETQAALGEAMSNAWNEAGNASTLGEKINGYARAVGYFATSLPGQLTGSALGQTSTDFGLELMTGYGYGGLTGSTGYQFLDIVETGSAYAVPLTGVYTFASPVRMIENGIGSAISGTARFAGDVASFAPGRTLASISGDGFAGNFSALPSVTPSALPSAATVPSPVTSVTPSVAPSQITPSNSAPARTANTIPSYVNAIARAIDPSNTPSAVSAPVTPVLRSAANDIARVSSDIGSDIAGAARLANVFSGTPAGSTYNDAAQLGRQAATRYAGAQQVLRQAVETPSPSVTTAQRALADLAEAEALRAAAAARLAQADAALAQESLTLLDEVIPQDIPVVTSRTAPFIISDTPLQRSLGSAVAFAPETGVGAAPLPVRSPFQLGPALKQSGDAIADLQSAGTRHGADISIAPAQPVTRPVSLDYHGLDTEVRGEYIKSSLDNAADGAVEWLNRPLITETKRLDGSPLSTRERMALQTELEGTLPQANELYEANKLRANSITGFGGHLQNVSRFLAPIDTPAANALKKLYDPNLFPAGRAYDELSLNDKLALTQRIDEVARQYLDIVSGRLPNTAAAAAPDIAPLARREISQAQANAMQNLADRNGVPLDNDFITKHWITDDIDSQSSAAKVFRDLVEGSPADQALVRAAANGDVDSLLAEIGGRMGAPQYVQPKIAPASGGVLNGLAKPLRPLVLGLSMILNPISPGSIPGLGALDNAITSVSPAAASEASRRGMTAARQAPLLGQEREIVASFYGNPGDATAGSRITSSGAIYDPEGFSIAHRDLRLGTKVLLDDGVHQPIVARVTNRGPFVKGRDVDLSYQAAKHFESTTKGITRLKMTVLDNPPDSVAYSFSKGRTDFNDGSVVTPDSARALVAQAQNAPSAPPARIAEAPSAPVENVVVTPDEIVNRALTADHPARAPVGTPQLEAINPLNEVDDFFGRIFTPTEQGVKDVVNQVTKQNPYIARTKLAAQVLKEQPSAAGTTAYKKLRDNVARELAGRKDGQGGVSAAEASRADAEIARQLAVLNGEVPPQRSIGDVAKSTGRPEIPGLEGKGHFMVPLQDPSTLPKRVAIIMHQTEGSYAAGHARAQMSRPNKVGTTIWVERDGTFYWAAPENANPKHIRSGNGLRGDNKYIDNSQTRNVIDNENTIGIEFAGNPPGRLQNPLTPEQLDTAAKLGRFLQERYNIPSDRVYAHSWIQHKAESSARTGDRYVEGAAAANVVRMLGYRPGIDSVTDFTSASDRALVQTAMANLPTGGPMDASVRTALRDMGDGVLTAQNAPVPDVPPNTFVEAAFNRVSPFNALPGQTAEQVVRNFITPSVLDNASPLDVRPAPVLVSEPTPAARPAVPTQVAANEPRVVPSASEPRDFGILDAVIETPIALGNGISRAIDAGSYLRNAFGGPEVTGRNIPDVAATSPQAPTLVPNEVPTPIAATDDAARVAQVPPETIDPIPPSLVAESRPIAAARVPLTEGEMIRSVTPTSVALRPTNRLGDDAIQVSEQPIQIASKTVRVEDIGGADATAVASADVKDALARAEAAEQRAIAAKVFLQELDTSKKLADNVNRLMSAYFNQGKVLDPQSLSSAIQKSVAQVNRFEKALANAEMAGALDTATAARVRELYAPVKDTSQLLDSQRPQLMRLVPNSHGKVSLGATFGVNGAAEGLQAIRTTPAKLKASLAERQALETAARSGAEKTIAAADTARAEAKRIAEAEQLRLAEQERKVEARAAQIVNRVAPGQVAYVEPATPGTWTSADATEVPKGPFAVSLKRGFGGEPAPDTPSLPQPPSDPFVLPIALRRDPNASVGTSPRPSGTDPALTPPPIPRQDPELPFPENTGARPDGEVSPELTTDGGPVAPQTQALSPYARLKNWASERVADYRRNRLAAGTGPTENLAPMFDSFSQRLDNWSRSEAPRLQQAQELSALEDAMRLRQELVVRNNTDLIAATPEPQQDIPSARDAELANAKREMSTALARFEESAQDLARAEEAFSRNTPDGDAEARALAASSLDKAREGAAAESRALTIVRANTDVPADDMIGRLSQWDARYAGARTDGTTDAGAGGSGGSGGNGADGSGNAAVGDRPSLYQRITGWWCLQGGWRSGTCALLGISGAGIAFDEYQIQTASSNDSETSFGGLPTDIPGSIVSTPDTSTTPGSDARPDTRPDIDQPGGGPGATPPGGDDRTGAGGPRGDGGDGSGAGPGNAPVGNGGGTGGFFRGGMSLFSGLLQGLMQWFGSGEEEEQSSPQQPTPAAQEPPVGAIVGNPQIVDAGDTTTLSWSTVGTDVSSSTCAIVTADFAVFARGGQNGNASSGALSESTRFGLVCNVKGAQDKLLNETLIRVRGDDTDPPRIFTDEQIAASQASAANPVRPTTQGSGTQSGSNSGGTSGSPAPQDVRTCDPEQSMDSFIRCLCEAEPNPRGCAVPPGGLRQ